MLRASWVRMAVLGAMLVGCGGEEVGESRGSQTSPPSPGSEQAEPGPLAEDTTYELRATAAGPYAAGQAGTFEIRLTPRGEYHVNTDPRFPFGIVLSGPDGVQFAEGSLDREDAAEFSEQQARFAVAFTPRAAGEHRVTATVDFAVCTPSTCLPEQRTLALVLPVQ